MVSFEELPKSGLREIPDGILPEPLYGKQEIVTPTLDPWALTESSAV